MAAFLFATENVVFILAIVLMLLIGAVQAIGIAGDFDLDIHSDADLLGWLGFGRLPLLATFLALFGMIGLVSQHLALDLGGALLSPLIAVSAAFLTGAPATGLAARLLSSFIPRDQSSAVPLDALSGSFARIVTGAARTGSPARARVEDAFGQAHYVMVEPDNAGQTLEEGETILLVRREDHIFRAISYGDHHLPAVQESFSLMPYLIISGTGLLLLIVLGVIVARLYKRASKEIGFVRTGFGGEKVVMNGGALVLPIFHETMPANMNTVRLAVERKNSDALITLDRLRIDVKAEFYVRVKPDAQSIATAAQTLGARTMNPEALKELVEGKFVDALRSVAAGMTMNQLYEQRSEFVQKVQQVSSVELAMNGLELESVC